MGQQIRTGSGPAQGCWEQFYDCSVACVGRQDNVAGCLVELCPFGASLGGGGGGDYGWWTFDVLAQFN